MSDKLRDDALAHVACLCSAIETQSPSVTNEFVENERKRARDFLESVGIPIFATWYRPLPKVGEQIEFLVDSGGTWVRKKVISHWCNGEAFFCEDRESRALKNEGKTWRRVT